MPTRKRGETPTSMPPQVQEEIEEQICQLFSKLPTHRQWQLLATMRTILSSEQPPASHADAELERAIGGW